MTSLNLLVAAATASMGGGQITKKTPTATNFYQLLLAALIPILLTLPESHLRSMLLNHVTFWLRLKGVVVMLEKISFANRAQAVQQIHAINYCNITSLIFSQHFTKRGLLRIFLFFSLSQRITIFLTTRPKKMNFDCHRR